MRLHKGFYALSYENVCSLLTEEVPFMFSDPTSKSAAMINSPIKNENVDSAIVRVPTRTMTERNVDVFHPGHNSTNGIVSASTQTNCVFQTVSLHTKLVTRTRKLHFMLPELALLSDAADYNNARTNCSTTTLTYIRNRLIHCFVSSSYYAKSNDRLIDEQ
jgi:hypothetical protein